MNGIKRSGQVILYKTKTLLKDNKHEEKSKISLSKLQYDDGPPEISKLHFQCREYYKIVILAIFDHFPYYVL